VWGGRYIRQTSLRLFLLEHVPFVLDAVPVFGIGMFADLAGAEFLALRAAHREDVVDEGVIHIAHAGERLDLDPVDLAVGQRVVVDMDADHLADYHMMHRFGVIGRQGDGRMMFAFQIDRRFQHTRAFDDVAWRRRQPAHRHLVDTGRHMFGRQIDLFAQLVGRHVVDKLAGILGIDHRVLAPRRGAFLIGGA
jgi:hypothetical protein